MIDPVDDISVSNAKTTPGNSVAPSIESSSKVIMSVRSRALSSAKDAQFDLHDLQPSV